MDSLDAARFMKVLVERTSRDRSKRTNWGRMLAVVLLSTLAGAAVASVAFKLAGLVGKGAPFPLVNRMVGAAFGGRLPTLWQRLVLPVRPVAPGLTLLWALIQRARGK